MIPPPDIKLIHHDKHVDPNTPYFLKVVRRWFSLRYPDGTISKPFLHDAMERRHMHAVAMIAHYKNPNVLIGPAKRFIYLRSAVRPNVGFYDSSLLNLWEVPAGLIEGKEDQKIAAIRETKEELGFDVKEEDIKPLGGAILTMVGVGPEAIYPFAIEVKPETRVEPSLDGSALEAHGKVINISLDEARQGLYDGIFKDSKTEIVIRRFLDIYG